MEINKQPINISITIGTIIKIIFTFLLFYFLFLVKDILAILFISFILSSAICPWVDKMQKLKIPRSISVLLIYLVLFSTISLIIYLIIPPIVEQTSELANNFPEYLEKVISTFSALKDYSAQHGLLNQSKNNLDVISSNLQIAVSSVLSTITGIFGGIFSFFLVLVLTFYIVAEKNAIKKLIWSIVTEKNQSYAIDIIDRIQKKISMWLSGQMILSLSIFVLVYIGLSILGVKYALVLALVAGLTEFVPYLGPIFGAIPAVFLALTQSPILGLFVVALYYIIQLVENNILVPKIMQKAVGINPVISIVALLIGFKIAGVVGAILSIPVATAVSILVKDIIDNKKDIEPI
ncbi:MAG: AI-2E family transporter [Patescibacteria group bacterium]|nr:AI-2E family transporter [Patescibacteria group bacterium]MBU1870902.1 AI-2E family transporter [Patescibacteria group bacterium]